MTRRLRLSLGAWRQLLGTININRSDLKWNTRLSYWLSGTGYSLLLRIQQSSYADALKAAVPSPPIFLLGFWRSGTTFLHELFCCDPRFGFPSTYACLNPSHFLLAETFVRKHAADVSVPRPMDNMRYSWASPQEDEFALLALGAPSPYEALIVPSLMRHPRSLLDLRSRSQEEQNRWVEALRYFIRMLAVQQAKTMVLKSPPHGFKLPLLPSWFPRSRFVIIERNPYEVFASNLSLWHTLLDMYSLESFSGEEIEDFVLSAFVLHEQAIAEGSQNLSSQSLARVRFEDLVAEPIREMARLYQQLDLGDFEVVRPRIEQHLAVVAGHTRNRFCVSSSQKERIDAAWGELIRGKEYGWPEQRAV